MEKIISCKQSDNSELVGEGKQTAPIIKTKTLYVCTPFIYIWHVITNLNNFQIKQIILVLLLGEFHQTSTTSGIYTTDWETLV